MISLLNKFFGFLKFVLLFVSFGITLYIVIGMYTRVQKSIIDSINIFVPYFILLVIFCINRFCKQKYVLESIFYNLTASLAFLTIVTVGMRSIFDNSMVLNEIMGYNINFSYFGDFLIFMKIILYGLILSNILLMICDKLLKKDKDTSGNNSKDILNNKMSDEVIEVL